MAHKLRQDDRPQIATTVGRQRLLATGVGRADDFDGRQIVVARNRVQKQNARLGVVIGRAHHRVPQVLRGHGGVNPQPVAALECAPGDPLRAGLRTVYQLPVKAGLQGCHKAIVHRHRDIEIVPATGRALGADEFQNVRVVHAQNRHLRPAPRTRALHRGAGLVKHVDVAARAGRNRRSPPHLRAARPDAGEVVAHAAATAHGLRSLAQGLVNAGIALVIHALDAVAHRLHKAVDQRGLDARTCRAHDASGTNRTGLQVG